MYTKVKKLDEALKLVESYLYQGYSVTIKLDGFEFLVIATS